MKVIIKKTGKIKEVADGYARNFLIPKGLATPATNTAVATEQEEQQKRAAKRKQDEAQWNTYLTKLEAEVFEVQAKSSDSGSLFGALPLSAIIQSMASEGYEVEETWLQLAQPIKNTGECEIGVRFPHGKKAQVRLRVV